MVWDLGSNKYMLDAVEWIKIGSSFTVVVFLCYLLGSTTADRKYLAVHSIEERSRRDIASCAGDSSPCSGVLRNTSRLMYGSFFLFAFS